MSDPRVPEDRPAKAAQQFLAQQPTWMDEVQAATVQDTRARLAYLIRAELVCCDVYDRANKGMDEIGADTSLTGSQKLAAMKDLRAKQVGPLVAQGAWHEICYYGEWSARLCETGELPEGDLAFITTRWKEPAQVPALPAHLCGIRHRDNPAVRCTRRDEHGASGSWVHAAGSETWYDHG